MKKIVVLIMIIVLVSGCANIKNNDLDKLIDEVQNSKLNLSNRYRRGYKYYLPTGMYVKSTLDFNELIINENIKYYLYVDVVSYYNNIKNEYIINKEAYISKDISYNDIDGYLEVNQIEDKYLIEIMYNYAKIELIVNNDDLKEGIINSFIILSTIRYNDDVIESIMGTDVLNFKEEKLSIFDIKGNESNFLEYIEKFDTYEEDAEIPDLDLIN